MLEVLTITLSLITLSLIATNTSFAPDDIVDDYVISVQLQTPDTDDPDIVARMEAAKKKVMELRQQLLLMNVKEVNCKSIRYRAIQVDNGFATLPSPTQDSVLSELGALVGLVKEARAAGCLPAPIYDPAVPPPPSPSVPVKLVPLYVGQTPNCNASIVTNHQNHLNCANAPLGYTIQNGAAAQQLLYLGTEANVNAGVVATKGNFHGGATQEYGYTIRDQFKLPGSAPLYAVVGCGINDGEVTTNPSHKNCPTTPVGWAYPW